MPNIIFNAQYVATEFFRGKLPPKMKQKNTGDMYQYYDRDEACDKSYYDKNNKEIAIDTKHAFDYYNYRIGSTGAFNDKGILNPNDVYEETQHYKPEIMYRCVFSFEDAFATKHNLKPTENMKELIGKTMHKNIHALGFNPENVNWGAYYHTNTNNPHVHVWFYEKERSKKRYVIPKETFKQVKSNVIRLMELNTELYIERDQRKETIFERLNELGFSEDIQTMVVSSENNSQKVYRIDPFFTKKLMNLEQSLPHKGSMKFNSKNIRPYQEDILDMVQYVKQYGGIKDLWTRYEEQLDREVEAQVLTYGGNEFDEDKQKFKQDKLNQFDTQLANLILSNIKEYRKDSEDFDLETDDNRKRSGRKRRSMNTRSRNIRHASIQELNKGIEESYYASQSLQHKADSVARKAQQDIQRTNARTI